MQHTDVLIVGAGMAGASLAYYLAPHARVLLLEREAQAGYHSTGRSAAMYVETYGNATVRAITTASKAFYLQPPAGFAAHPLLTPRGALLVGGAAQQEQLRQAWRSMRALAPSIEWWEQAAILQRVPVLRPQAAAYAVYEPHAMDMDVHAIHHGFLRGAKAAGARLLCDAGVTRVAREGGVWCVQSAAGEFSAPLLVNAAGAWCDELARLGRVAPIGLLPKRRTAFTFDAPAGLDCAGWPLVIDAQEQFYFKPDAGLLLGSPANEDAVPAQDVQPEELDVALGVHRLNEVTTLDIRRPQRPWAGLRSFVADGGLVGGFEPLAPGFFWVAAQGGYGVQTAPAMGEACAALARGLPLPGHIAREGVTEHGLGPGRLARANGLAAA